MRGGHGLFPYGLFQRLFVGKPRQALLCVCALLFACAWVWAYRASRAWASEDVPIAFWSWRQTAPSDEEIETARTKTKANAFFIRAGQFDIAGEAFTRTRSVAGRMPRGATVHLVYNATGAMLERFAEIDTARFAAHIAEIYREDFARGTSDGCRIVGLQLDIDAPTSQLPRYAALLRSVRALLAPATQLSITGLPTWMDAPALRQVLAATDFWIPQFYGDLIPKFLNDAQTISSPLLVRRQVAQARRLKHPFYAGLAAYSHTLLYSAGGNLIALRGDIAASDIAHQDGLQAITRQGFPVAKETPASICEWRYIFRATRDVSLRGWNIRRGEHLVLNVPNGAGLRHAARMVRAEGGTNLRGICIFRLPAANDDTTLKMPEIAAALADRAAVPATRVRLYEGLTSPANATHDTDATGTQFTVTATNEGATGSRLGEDALTVTLNVPRGKLDGVSALDGFTSIETLCEANTMRDRTSDARDGVMRLLRPCSWKRASIVRLRASAWQAGTQAHATFITCGDLPPSLRVEIEGYTDDDRQWNAIETLRLEKSTGRANHVAHKEQDDEWSYKF